MGSLPARGLLTIANPMPAKDGGLALLYSGPHNESVWLLHRGHDREMRDPRLEGEEGLDGGGLTGQELHPICDGEARKGTLVKQLDLYTLWIMLDMVWRTDSRGFKCSTGQSS